MNSKGMRPRLLIIVPAVLFLLLMMVALVHYVGVTSSVKQVQDVSPVIDSILLPIITRLTKENESDVNMPHIYTYIPNLSDYIQNLSDSTLDRLLEPTGREVRRKLRTSVPTFWLPSNIPLEELVASAIPSNVHYFWCGKRWFEFKHYLSVLSVLKSILPNRVTIHYEFYPLTDKNLYNLWIEDLKHDYQFLTMTEMSHDQKKYCSFGQEEKQRIILNVLNKEGGIYVGENTWILSFQATRRLGDIENALDIQTMEGYMLLRAGVASGNESIDELSRKQSLKAVKNSCSPVHNIFHQSFTPMCITLKGEYFDRFYPMSIWKLDNTFGRLVRKLFYNNEAILKPKPSYDSLVPNIGHMVWIGGGPMDFVFYLSLLSMLFVAKVDVVYIHGDFPPRGPYWEKLQSIPRISNRIRCVTIIPPSLVYQGTIEPWYKALMSDIIRVDIMLKYGGVYTDTDAIWVKPLTVEERGYEAVACYDWVDWSYPYPDSVNFGVSYGKRNAPFWKYFQDSMRVLHNDHHGFTGVTYPYKLLERYPDLLLIDKRLSVICYYSRCHPIWVKNYHDMNNDHVRSNSIPDWRNDVHAFHWTYPNPTEYHNETILMKSTGLFADIGKNVLELAGLRKR